ncbi:MAG TPA: HPr kinase/phosphatase C-terminal domain-containing protein [Xanthobacteraceae bacterium]|nr:HPr kinase/phosphatase C-terminal domain-containing protein [Xanthobacteraceae bacterium]
MPEASETIHASAVLAGERAVIIRGPSGAGKSRLALALIEAAKRGSLSFARLVADDRIRISAAHGRLLVAAPETIEGMIEVHGLGIRAAECERMAVAGWIVDLAAKDAERMPELARTEILGVTIPRLPVAAGQDPLPILLAALFTAPMG